MHFPQGGDGGGKMKEGLVRVDYVEGGSRVLEACEDIAGFECEVGVSGDGVGGTCYGGDVQGEVYTCDAAMGYVGAEAGGNAARAATDVEYGVMRGEVRQEEGCRIVYGAFGVGGSDS